MTYLITILTSVLLAQTPEISCRTGLRYQKGQYIGCSIEINGQRMVSDSTSLIGCSTFCARVDEQRNQQRVAREMEVIERILNPNLQNECFDGGTFLRVISIADGSEQYQLLAEVRLQDAMNIIKSLMDCEPL